MGQSAKHKKLQMEQRGYPDLLILEARNGYHGLFIELKKSKSEVFLKDGTTYKKVKKPIKQRGKIVGYYDHIQEQVKMHQMLRQKGYAVEWGFGLTDTLKKIDAYLSNTTNK